MTAIKLFAGILVLASSGLPAHAENASADLLREDWTRINQYSNLEGFHSQGSFGWHLGLGLATGVKEEAVETGPILDEERELSAPRVFLSKGTPWPVDLGVSASRFDKSGATQFGGHIQWTIFEGFSLPSLAIRYSRMNLSKMRELEFMNTDSFQIGSTYGIWRYLSVSASVAKQWEKASTRPYEAETYALTELEAETWTAERWTYSWGVNIHPFTPFIALGFEQVFWDKEAKTSIAKLSFML